ncbi:hypothetical protein Tco_0950914 [Tanacetum coccineum]
MEYETLYHTRRQCKWEDDDYICRGHILNDMSDALFDVYQNVDSAKGSWDQLESKYMAEDVSIYTTRLENDESILKHNKDELSLVQLGSDFRIEESLRVEESGKNKVKEIVGSSTMNIIEDGKNKNGKKIPRERKGRMMDDAFAWWIESGATCHASFLNGDLEEEVYMKQSAGFVMPGNEIRTDQDQVVKMGEFLSSNFSIKDMGEADIVLGIKIKREDEGITITQSHYIELENS